MKNLTINNFLLMMRQVSLFLFILFSSGCDEDSENNASIEIYIDDGAIQCLSQGFTPEQTAQPLINAGIDVLSSTCGFINGLAVAAQCGLGDTNINIHRIWRQNLADAVNLGFSPVSDLSEGYTEVCAD